MGMKWARIAAILPVGKLYDRVFAGALAAAAAEAGSAIARVEPEFSATGKLGAVCQELELADLIVADITARNPHVMYLAGYAHGTGREVLFIAQHGEDFPFDLAKHRAIFYGGDLEFLKAEFRSHLLGEEKFSAPKSADAREQFLSAFGDLLAKYQHQHKGEIQLENPTTFVLLNQDMELALVQDLARRARELGLRIKLM